MQICVSCVGDAVLRDWIAEMVPGTEPCDYCRSDGKSSVHIFALADRVDHTLREFYELGEWSSLPSAWEDEPPSDTQDGQLLADLLRDVCGVSGDVGQQLAEELTEHFNDDDEGAIFSYDLERRYVHRKVETTDWLEKWADFEERIRHRARFFDRSTKRALEAVIDYGDLRKGAAVLVVGPETSHEFLYRARRAKTKDDVKRIVSDPVNELRALPPRHARAGRMNPAGIRAFYGAFDRDVCIAEVRPAVGSWVVIGRFRLLRPMRLLNLRYFEHAGPKESLFSPDYRQVAERWEFLRSLQERLARPVQEFDEPLEYLATQAMAEYVCDHMELEGIVYRSAQTGSIRRPDGGMTIRTVPTIQLPLFSERHEIASPARADHPIDPLLSCNIVLLGAAAIETRERWSEEGASTNLESGAIALTSETPEVHQVKGVQIHTDRDFTLEPPTAPTLFDHTPF
jgi:hypothetical protein